jgi:hypothetical protein
MYLPLCNGSHGTLFYTHRAFLPGTAHITFHNITADAILFQNPIGAGHDTHTASGATAELVFDKPGLRIFGHGAGHTGVYTFRNGTMTAKDRSRLVETVNNDPIAAVGSLVEHDTSGNTGKTPYAF